MPGGGHIEQWTGLDRLKRIRAAPRRTWFEQTVVAVDVQNSLLGRRGTTRIYGPQKGLRPVDFAQTERCLRRLARTVGEQFGQSLADGPGAGSAGGLGFGLRAFLGAKLEPGFALFARLAALERHLRRADLVITGEGAIDRSSFMGKGAGQIVQRCRELGIPCFALAGVLACRPNDRGQFTGAHALTDLVSVREAKARPAYWLERLAEQVARSATIILPGASA